MNTRLVSKYLQLLRKEYDFTQENLAQELGISRQAVSKWETGNTIPDLETLIKLSKLYHISINDILEPKIPSNVIGDFEQIIEITEIDIKNILKDFNVDDIVKASMGASPAVNEFLKKLFSDIDFEKAQAEIGRIKITDIEEIHNQIIAMINLEITNMEMMINGRKIEKGDGKTLYAGK